MEQFNLEYQWKLYLDRVGLKEETMYPVQLQETKRAFYGACGQLLFLMRDDVGAIEDDSQAVEVMQNMIDQVGNFWMKETNKLS